MIRTPKEELYNRVHSLQTRLASENMTGALIVHNVNLFYFSGTVQQAFLFVPAAGEALLFVRKNPDRVKRESFLEQIIPIGNMRDLPERLADFGYGSMKKLGMELDVLPVTQYLRYLNMLGPDQIVDVWPAVRAVRTIKSEYELGQMRAAATLSDSMIETVLTFLREGITEIELVAEIEKAARVRGHQGYVRMRGFNQEIYWGHLVSGPEAADPAFINFATGGRGLSTALPSGSGWRVIGKHEPVIVDLCACLNGYNVDQTRTFCLGGLPEKLERAYDVSCEIGRKLEELIRPGVEVGEFFAKAQRMAEAYDLGEHFMGYGKGRAGFIGHGVGLELDELPVFVARNREPLAVGMVFALEPKFSFPDAGVVGIEDNFAVTEDGSEKLTSASYDVTVNIS